MKMSGGTMKATHLARGMLFLLGMLFCSITNATIIDFAFTSGGATSATTTNAGLTATINADGGQSFTYPISSYLRSALGSSGDTLTLTLNQAIDSLSFDIGSLDSANNERVAFTLTPIVSAPNSVDWFNGGLAVLTGNTLSHGGMNHATARVSFTGLGGITSFTFAEEFTGHGIYFDNFTVSTISVAEPTTLALLSLGLFGLGFNRRKRFH
jgi:hypothetical protein